MADYKKTASFRSAEEFREYVKSRGFFIGLAEGTSKLAEKVEYKGRTVGNRWAVLPMEGWDCESDGNPSELTRRRWVRFAQSGAKLLYGTEAGAVIHSGRSNPKQLMVAEHTADCLKSIQRDMRAAHKEKFGTDDDLLIGLQLTHSGRFSHPNRPDVLEAKTAYAHPLLDAKYGCGPQNVITDAEIRDVIRHFITAAKVAQRAGFDFVDIKHAHGYLGHELLSAYDRPGEFGGSFENRTRFFREIAEGIQKEVPGMDISSRVSLFDIFPFVKGSDGVGVPMRWSGGRYPYAFGGDGTGMDMDPDLSETVQLIQMMKSYGVKLICATIGSPYYNVHMQRPAYYPVCDGYDMPEDPLYNVGRHLKAVARIKELCPDVMFVGSGFTCLQEFLPAAAEYTLEHKHADFIGIGRMVLSYPDLCADVLAGKPLDRRRICRTFGECTNAPRNGMVSGCYPLDEYYKGRPEACRLRELKKCGGCK